MRDLKVLLVEDHSEWQSILQEKIRRALQDTNHLEVRVLRTFDEAYKSLNENQWDLLITDIGLGDSFVSSQKLGIQLIELASERQIPAIAVSGTPHLTTQNSADLVTENGAIFFSKQNFDSKKFVAKIQSLVRNKEDFKMKIILILASSPVNEARLRLDKEVHEIDEGLRRSQRCHQFRLDQRWAVRADDLRRALLDIEPQIVHFCGHGTGEDGLLIQDEDGNSKLVSTEALKILFELCASHVECVLLNACYSEVQANAIVGHINYVIGMSKAIGDKAAIKFATGFYDAIGAGKSVETAYKFGCNAIQLENIPEHLTPRLKKRQ
ncbi:MAG: CHAT domain-containing protein [Nostoc sp. DedQUE04]|uniref:CHAT domain-containing protein n=1 Tax=Nostoc sp. DedQUE04 TaxID=3075390 RepID=UPI002AD430EB|nr:CHAT domain-containing protein [Nostoc sp. DedQUE04]MDZ8139815.1 CHAT domain-containing protein [Nostoc sp. DedQUE04]